MKKLLSALIASTIFAAGVFSAPKSPVMEPLVFEPVTEQGAVNEYRIDPRVEIIGSVCRLSEMEGFLLNYNNENEILSQIDAILAKYKNHKIVKTTKSLAKKGIDSSAMLSLAYHIKPDFSGTIIDFSPFPDTLYHAWKKVGTKAIYDYIKQLHDFAIESSFSRIYLLNKGTYIADTGNMKRDIDKSGIAQWTQDFFKNDECETPVIVVSRLCASGNYYDFALDSEGKKHAYLTTYPGTYYNTIESTYVNFYTQLYATKNWEQIKTNFIKYNKDYVKKYRPENAELAEKEEATDYNLAVLMSMYCYLAYLKEVKPENHFSYEELYGAIEKGFGDPNIMKTAELIDEYTSARDKYPTFDDFAPRLNEFINTITIE